MIVHIKEIIKKAKKGDYAVGAFNTANLETTLGIVRAAVAMKSPIIIQISEKTISYAGLKEIVAIIKSVVEAEGQKIPVAVHLDHGKNFKIFSACVRAGLSSAHLDASDFPLKKNIALTKKGAVLGHRFGAWVQGELGSLLGYEGLTKIKLPKNRDAYLTDPDQARDFVKKTGIDTLAVAVGTMHGHFAGQEKINFPRLKAIVRQVALPLVLHGASGALDAEVRRAAQNGISIANFDTDLRIAFTKKLRQTIKAEKNSYDPRMVLSPSIEAIAAVVKHKIKLLGSAHKA